MDLPPRPRDRYDETHAPDGSVRPHWRALLAAWQSASPADWRGWQDAARERIRQNGITYNVYTDPKGADRPWPLDVVPLVLPAAEWAGLSAAVAQRARLLDRVLADLYGPQQLLADRALPPALVYGHNGYLWPCRGIVPPGGRYLHVYAADIARGPDGRWWVLADRTQAPSGAGYALENRMIVSRLFAEPFRDLHVQHPADYFRALRDRLVADAPVDAGEPPFVVVLTPGAHNETYFEHVYLARQLGFTLVEGQDLTVRGDTLYLKTLDGLKRIHAVLRRLDDDYCDPLDLRADSTLGVAGLLQVARAGRVLVANALGTGLLESSAITGFLPGLCERLLGEPLAMPSVATWWCGEAAALAWVEEHLDRLVLKPAFPSQRMEPVFGNRLDADARARWIARLRAQPNAYVAQELVQLSQAPVLVSDLTTGDEPQLQWRSIGLRVYAVATDDGYRVLPGGLARVAGDTSLDVVSMQRGGSSKDTWVLADTPSSLPAPARTAGGLPERARHPDSLASRAAENLFWLGRYSERVACHARLLRNAIACLLENGEDGVFPRWLALCAQAGVLPPPSAAVDQRLLAAVFDPALPGSLAASIARAARAGGQVRERLSADHWQAVERLPDAARRAAQGRPRLDVALALLDRLLLAATSLMGYVMDDMVRDAGWRFLVAGRRIERVQFVAAMTGCLLQRPDPVAAAVLLAVADCEDTWRQRYPASPAWLPALDIVVFDADNPRALVFQAATLQRGLEKLVAGFGDLPDGGLAAALAALLAPGPVGAEPAAGAWPHAAGLAARIDALHAATGRLSDALGHRFFAHVDGAAPRWMAV